MEIRYIAGALCLVLGALMMLWRRAIGARICRFGELSWKNNHFGVGSDFTDNMFDERKIGRIVLLLGAVVTAAGAFVVMQKQV